MNGNILIIDDDIEQSTYIMALLKTSGYHPVVVESGETGFSLAKINRPDLIVVNLMMPGEEGLRFYRKLRSDPDFFTMPLVVLSNIPETAFLHYRKSLNSIIVQPLVAQEAVIETPLVADMLLYRVNSLIS